MSPSAFFLINNVFSEDAVEAAGSIFGELLWQVAIRVRRERDLLVTEDIFRGKDVDVFSKQQRCRQVPQAVKTLLE